MSVTVLTNKDVFDVRRIVSIQGPYKSDNSDSEHFLEINGRIVSIFSTKEEADSAKWVLTKALDDV